jgi:hypothetical protein
MKNTNIMHLGNNQLVMKKIILLALVASLFCSCSRWVVYGHPIKKSTLNKAIRQAQKQQL